MPDDTKCRESILAEMDVRMIGNRKFLIPSYQRGYRWTKENVTDLLDDLVEFCVARNKFSKEPLKYCLQPIVLQDVGCGLRIVDGQQRLTTISLILYKLSGKIEKIKWDIEYEELHDADGNRLNLKRILDEGGDGSINWVFIKGVLEAIGTWKGEHPADAQTILELLDTDCTNDSGVFFLEYRFDDNSDSSGQRTYNEINDGRTPLTSSELLKAMFLVVENGLPEIERQSIAKEWELIERRLSDKKMWSIWYTKDYDSVFTRIDLLFAVVCNVPVSRKSGDPLYIYHAVEEWVKKDLKAERMTKMKSLSLLWEKVLRCFWWMEYCFKDTDIHNFLGWLAWNTQDQVATVYKSVWCSEADARCMPVQMLPCLKRFVYKKFAEGNISLDLAGYRYLEEGNKGLVRILSLVNVLMANKGGMRIPFEFINCRKDWSWQIEHIDSRTENEKDKEIGGEKIRDKDAISNLTLLDSKTNEGYHNATFPEKRKIIMEVHNNLAINHRPIMPCTLNAFTKMCVKEVPNKDRWDMRLWDEQAAKAYFKEMERLVEEFKKEAENV